MDEKLQFTVDEAHLYFAKSLNGETWELLEKPDRSAGEGERMLAAAFASYYHWLCVGQGVHLQRAEYLIARACLALGDVPNALLRARGCLKLSDQFSDEIQDFDLAYAYEITARTNAAAGSLDIAGDYRAMAKQAGDRIADQEDREIFLTDLDSGDWYGLSSLADRMQGPSWR